MGISLDAEKAIDKIQQPFKIKGLGEIRDTKGIPKHNKANIQQTNRNIHIHIYVALLMVNSHEQSSYRCRAELCIFQGLASSVFTGPYMGPVYYKYLWK